MSKRSRDKKDDTTWKITCVLCSQGSGAAPEQWGCLPPWWFPFVPALSPLLVKVKDNSQKRRLLPG